MIRFAVCLFLSLLCFPIHANRPLEINVFSLSNGHGLENDRQILTKALQDLGHIVHEKEWRSKEGKNAKEQADINIFFQWIGTGWLPKARLNWLIPNPEWHNQKKPGLLDGIDLVVCRTRESEQIFRALNMKTYFLGFTSHDSYRPEVKKDYVKCLHLGGTNPFKATPNIVEAWRSNFLLPLLVLVTNPSMNIQPLYQANVEWMPRILPLEELRYLQNHCGIHICTSEAEGYGHYINEALSAKAIVITTDGAPMNELVTDKRFLVPYHTKQPSFLGTRFFVHPSEISRCVQNVLSLPQEELERMGDLNRENYLQRTQEFKMNLKRLLESVQ